MRGLARPQFYPSGPPFAGRHVKTRTILMHRDASTLLERQCKRHTPAVGSRQAMPPLTGLVHRGAFWHQIEKAPIILGLFRQEHSRILSFPRKFAHVFSWANEKKDFLSEFNLFAKEER
jgi:hypothetical protein